ncbi:MAG: pyruvate carboxylase subunit B [Synergistaceae bacterium]|jgi:oxaloacetate decarboxylase alpha subunit|nr:pyruvate carboxylase subunit B [Synergistaceae bacterium]
MSKEKERTTVAAPRKAMIMETALRDAHQSLFATRMRTEDMIPILETMDEVGYYSLEMWGGATFDTCMRFLDEDPWERLRVIRKHIKKAKLQMLLRGQNLVGYRHYADDAVREFVKAAIGNGIDIIRVFDALNDLRNMEVAADQVKKEGGHLQMCISYTLSPVHTLEAFADMAQTMARMGADSIAFKDMAGLLNPVDCASLLKAVKSKVDLPIQLHSHYTSGMASMTYYAGLEAGASIVDTAISPLSMGTSQPPTESLVASLAGGPLDTGIKLENLIPVAEHFKKIREKYSHLIADIGGVDINILRYQVPGGMYSNMVNQLKEQNALDKLDEVMREIPMVRKAMGYPPLVTPTSQIVGTQATLNVVTGQRWKVIPKEVKQYFLGFYGTPPAPLDPEVQKLAIGSEEPITCRPGEKIAPEMETARRDAEAWTLQPEDALTWIMFPQVAKDFLPKKFARAHKRDVGLNDLVDGSAYPA